MKNEFSPGGLANLANLAKQNLLISKVCQENSQEIRSDFFVSKCHGFKIQKINICLHGKACHYISLMNDRQVCRKADQPIFDMGKCPLGIWSF